MDVQQTKPKHELYSQSAALLSGKDRANVHKYSHRVWYETHMSRASQRLIDSWVT
jgi:hypothetical protein